MPLTNKPPASLTFFDGRPPREPLPEDAPENHQTEGRHFYVNVADLAPAFVEAGELLANVDPPPRMSRIGVRPVLDIVRDLQNKRSCINDGDPSVTLCYRADGRFIAYLPSLDGLWKDYEREVDRETLITIDLRPPPPAQLTHGGYERPGLDVLHRMAVEDGKELALWHVEDGTGRTWRPGTPWSEPIREPDPAVWEMLSARARRRITSAIHDAIDHSSRLLLADSPVMSFRTDGTCTGWGTPLTSPEDTANETFIKVRVGLDSDHDDVAPWLDRIRIDPSGKVHLLP